jgi:positive regulator of sigma E activity
MPEIKGPSPEDLRSAFLAYEAALSPLVLAIALGILGNFLDGKFLFLHKMAMPIGAVLGFVIGIVRIFSYLKENEKNKKDN